MTLKIRKGFTLIELLVTIAIIGILASIVLVTLGSAKEKAKRVSALASVKSAMPELSVCKEDDGEATTSAIPAGGPICCLDGDTCADIGTDVMSGHDQAWPDITTSTGWTYDSNAPTGALIDDDYQYAIISADASETITCSFATKSCE